MSTVAEGEHRYIVGLADGTRLDVRSREDNLREFVQEIKGGFNIGSARRFDEPEAMRRRIAFNGAQIAWVEAA